MKKQKQFCRSHGILMPIFSLNSAYGIGTLGKPCFDFIDFLCRAGAGLWQMLPIGPTGYGDSPYQCFSAFAGNPYFLDPEWFLNKGWITAEGLNLFKSQNTGKVDYGWLFKTRKKALQSAYNGFLRFAAQNDKKAFAAFKEKNAYWLEDYTSFMALKHHFKGVGRGEFGKFGLKNKESNEFALGYLADQREYYAFLEFAFDAQWRELKSYAKSKGILLIGDIPLYVSNDSADVWSSPNLFMLNTKGEPACVAGVPPDIFSKDGQLWGNPLYNWQAMEENGFEWWRQRVARLFEMFNVIRLDHFIGICNYYKIPANEPTAKNGEWCIGPAEKLINAINSASKGGSFIAEDLGNVTKDVTRLLEKSGYPKMVVMQFAFEGNDNENLIHNIPKNSVVYTGTHDNQTLCGFFETASPQLKRTARRYLNVKRNKELSEAVIRYSFLSPANTVIIPLYDYLGLGDIARINTPAKTQNNWAWRTVDTNLNMLADSIYALAKIYKREKEK